METAAAREAWRGVAEDQAVSREEASQEDAFSGDSRGEPQRAPEPLMQHTEQNDLSAECRHPENEPAAELTQASTR